MRQIIADLMDSVKYLHIMLDVETTSTRSDAGVWQFGLATSDGQSWEYTCDPASVTGHQDADTLDWQSRNNGVNWHIASTQRAYGEKDLARELLTAAEVYAWQAKQSGKKVLWWAKSKEFDFTIVTNLMRRYELDKEFSEVEKFRNRHEYRTLQLLTGNNANPPAGAHNALVDARFQMDNLFTMLSQLA